MARQYGDAVEAVYTAGGLLPGEVGDLFFPIGEGYVFAVEEGCFEALA